MMERSQKSTLHRNVSYMEGQEGAAKMDGYYASGSPKKLVLVLKKMNISGDGSGGSYSQTDSGNSAKYRCFGCCMTFRTLQSYTKHIKIHEGGTRYKCPECTVTLSSKKVLNQHLKRQHGRPIGTVQPKGKGTIPKPQTQAKTNDISATKYRFKCSLCSLLFKTPGGFRKHELSHESKYKCKVCGRQLKSSITLAKHYSEFHMTMKLHRCMLCTKSFDNDHLLRKHIVRSHREAYRCCECNVSFVSAKDLESHLKDHSETCTLLCSYCHEDIPDVSGFRSHIMVCKPVKHQKKH